MRNGSANDNVAALCFEAGLTRRQTQVVCLHAEGWTVQQIAAELQITPHAAECHLSNAGLRIRAEWERRAQQTALREAVQELRERSEGQPATPRLKKELTSVFEQV